MDNSLRQFICHHLSKTAKYAWPSILSRERKIHAVIGVSGNFSKPEVRFKLTKSYGTMTRFTVTPSKMKFYHQVGKYVDDIQSWQSYNALLLASHIYPNQL